MQDAVNKIAREIACIENNISMLADTLADINSQDGVTRSRYKAYIDELKARRDAVTWTLEQLGFGYTIDRQGRELSVYVFAPTSFVRTTRSKKVRAA